jgi:hypothetical protein
MSRKHFHCDWRASGHRAGAFFKGHVQASAQSLKELQNGCRFRFQMDSITGLPVESKTAAEIVAW